jgi:hypothetical protein
MASRTPSTLARRKVRKRARTAYHEAGHAVLSSAINDRPELVSIRPKGSTLGRTRQSMLARPAFLVQVHLAGFAAEHLLTRRCPRQFTRELGFAMALALQPELEDSMPGMSATDQYLAIRSVLSIGAIEPEPEAIRGEIGRFYEVARESLATVWPAVEGVARALLKHEELDHGALGTAMGGVELYSPVFAVQRAHGLLPSADASESSRPAP